ncbi:bola-like protein-domain-containing protein [Usnea florida]
MLRGNLFGLTRLLSTMSTTPVEDAMRLKLTAALQPSTLEIYNDSSKHAHHQAMQGSVSKETHFRVLITSEAFKSKMQPARHRMVYALLKEELERAGGIHALQLRTRTLEEEERQMAREKAEEGEKIAEVEER